ncbi:MAG: hypothetical protein OEW35_08555 [Gammaproteobacteria bacterium]|nr:hypothetical protein [Gammaproteobacteria bacterium]MDH4255797.1 hypothetical protein [Gammaproteobacteria bacterium]MDH5309240.1 hypothetical protein [Gammaproteobacteria bacterium]
MNQTNRSIALSLLALLALTGAGRASAQDGTAGAPLFADQQALHIRIEGPLSTMTSERSNTDYYEGKLAYTDDAGASIVLDIGFRTRGNFRRRKDTCWFPPVRLNFQKKQVDGTVFDSQDKLKLVTHCHPRNDKYEQYVLKEYLAYRILQLHTPYALQVRLLRISWVDTDKGGDAIERYGFLIEDEDAMAERLDASKVDFNSTAHTALNTKQAAIASVFEFLIANTDFSLIKAAPEETCCHNAILLTRGEEEYFPVPYDFDFSGLVNAPYAEPSPNMRIRSVTTRLYRGNCSVNPEIGSTVALFREQQNAVLDLVTMQEGLSDSMRKYALKFLEDFYELLADPAAAEAKFIEDCL